MGLIYNPDFSFVGCFSAAQKSIAATISTSVVRDQSGSPAAGRTVLLLGRDQAGAWAIVGQAETNIAGEYNIIGPWNHADRLWRLVIGHDGEFSHVLGHLVPGP